MPLASYADLDTQTPRLLHVRSVHSDQRHAADRPKPAQSILHFPVEILTNIAVHLVVDRSSQRLRVLKTNQLGNLLRVEARRPNLIEFKDLLCFGLTCKYLHSVCQRIYQKQVVLTLPSTKYILGRKQSEVQRECLGKTLINSCYTRTIQTHDSVARHWSGAQNVNWLFISNQHYYQPKSSAMFSGLISSTARLTRSFSNLKFLCLSRLNNETILLCLERGVGKNLKALSITLSEVEDSEACLRHLDHRIARLNTISHLQALQVNDIEPTWVGLINRIHDLKEISLHITNFNPKMVQIFNRQANARKLEIFGGIRDTPIGPSFFQLIHKIFPQIETFKCGLHFGGKENLHFGEVSQYAAVLGQFACLRQFVFNHHNIAEKIDYCEQTSSTRHVLERFYNYSAPYFQTSRSLREIISIDFSDRKLVSGILAERIDLRQDAKSSWPGNVDERVNPQKKFSTSGLNGSGSKSHVHPTVDMLMPAVLFQDSEKSAVKMSKIPDVRDTIMVSFEHRWIRID